LATEQVTDAAGGRAGGSLGMLVPGATRPCAARRRGIATGPATAATATPW
jgi:hypothetical protein